MAVCACPELADVRTKLRATRRKPCASGQVEALSRKDSTDPLNDLSLGCGFTNKDRRLHYRIFVLAFFWR